MLVEAVTGQQSSGNRMWQLNKDYAAKDSVKNNFQKS